MIRVLNQISRSDELILTDINNLTKVLNLIVEQESNYYAQIKLTQVSNYFSFMFTQSSGLHSIRS